MILVSVGTARDFSRLVKEVDKIAEHLNDEVIVQKGYTKYNPKNCKYFDFISRDNFSKLLKKADIVITHGGVGTIISSLNLGKPTIVVPRRRKYNEHKNDHQMDIAKELGKVKMVIACYEIKDLSKKISEARGFKIPNKRNEKIKMMNALQNFIELNCR